jgi:hypothetical protein
MRAFEPPLVLAQESRQTDHILEAPPYRGCHAFTGLCRLAAATVDPNPWQLSTGKIVTRVFPKAAPLVPLGALRRAHTDGLNLYGDWGRLVRPNSHADHDTLRVRVALHGESEQQCTRTNSVARDLDARFAWTGTGYHRSLKGC